MNDQDIISLLQDKKTDKAFLKLYKYYPKVQSLIKSNSGSSDDAQDIYQEALIVFYQKVQDPTFQLTSAIGTYLYGVSKLMWQNELRKRSKKSSISLDDYDLEIQSQIEPELEEDYQVKKFAERALSQIGQKCLTILSMFYYDSMSFKDIASKLGHSTEKSAKNAKYKCLQRAKAKLVQLKSQESVNA